MKLQGVKATLGKRRGNFFLRTRQREQVYDTEPFESPRSLAKVLLMSALVVGALVVYAREMDRECYSHQPGTESQQKQLPVKKQRGEKKREDRKRREMKCFFKERSSSSAVNKKASLKWRPWTPCLYARPLPLLRCPPRLVLGPLPPPPLLARQALAPQASQTACKCARCQRGL